MADSKNKFYKLGTENEMLKSKITDRGIGYDASNRRDDETMNLSQNARRTNSRIYIYINYSLCFYVPIIDYYNMVKSIK